MMVQRIYGMSIAYVTGRTLPHHHVHTEEKYSKFAYSGRYAFCVPRSMHSIGEAAPDSMLAFQLNGRIYTKGITEQSQILQNQLVMEWSPCPGIRVKTIIILCPQGHRRIQEIISDYECIAYDCGFALPADRPHDTWCVTILGKEGTETEITASPNTNLRYPKTVISCARYKIERGTQTIITEFRRIP